MSVTIKLKQGLKSGLPTSGLTVGEPLFCTDTKEFFIADSTTSSSPAMIDVSKFSPINTMASGDLLSIYDISEPAASVRSKSITFENFKAALNIPAASTDEMVACASGATAGYLGTNGTDGILRVNTSGLKMTAGDANAYVTLALSFPSEAQGDIIYRGASAYARLAAGTQGALLSSGGAAANPSWITLIDGGTFS